MMTLICKRRPVVVEVSEVVLPNEYLDDIIRWCGGEKPFFEDANFAFTIPNGESPHYVEWGGRVVHEADGSFTAITELDYVTNFTWSGYVRRDRNG